MIKEYHLKILSTYVTIFKLYKNIHMWPLPFEVILDSYTTSIGYAICSVMLQFCKCDQYELRRVPNVAVENKVASGLYFRLH